MSTSVYFNRNNKLFQVETMWHDSRFAQISLVCFSEIVFCYEFRSSSEITMRSQKLMNEIQMMEKWCENNLPCSKKYFIGRHHWLWANIFSTMLFYNENQYEMHIFNCMYGAWGFRLIVSHSICHVFHFIISFAWTQTSTLDALWSYAL